MNVICLENPLFCGANSIPDGRLKNNYTSVAITLRKDGGSNIWKVQNGIKFATDNYTILIKISWRERDYGFQEPRVWPRGVSHIMIKEGLIFIFRGYSYKNWHLEHIKNFK